VQDSGVYQLLNIRPNESNYEKDNSITNFIVAGSGFAVGL
jgi:hypothetical protein